MLRRQLFTLFRCRTSQLYRCLSEAVSTAEEASSASKLDEQKNRRLEEMREELRRTRQKIKTFRLQDMAINAESGSSEVDPQSLAHREDIHLEQRAKELAEILGETHHTESLTPQKKDELSPERREYMKKKLGQSVFRKISYDEGELEKSDLTKPPSPENPHPFDPTVWCPPTHSRSIAPYVNASTALQALVELGVDLFEVDTAHPRLSRHLVRLDLDRDVKPRIQWLVNEVGMEPNDLGDYLTRNPFFLIQSIEDMKARVNYLEAKKFNPEQIVTLIREFRYWLNVPVTTLDARLGWIQKQFSLKGKDVRAIVIKEPRIIMFGLGPLQRLVNLFNKELKFTPNEMKDMLLNDPRLYMMDAKFITANYHYVHRVMGLSNELIAAHPLLLRCSLSAIRNRHEFLRKLGRAHYYDSEGSAPDVEATAPGVRPEAPVTISMEDFLSPSDTVFANKAANTYLSAYDQFLRNH